MTTTMASTISGSNRPVLLVLVLAIAAMIDRPGQFRIEARRETSNIVRRRTTVRGTTANNLWGSSNLRESRGLGVGKHGNDGKNDKSGRKSSGNNKSREGKSPKNAHDEEHGEEAHKLPEPDEEDAKDKEGSTKSKREKDNRKSKGGRGHDKDEEEEDETEHYTEDEAETFRRGVPEFGIQYKIPSTRSSEVPVLSDYNELSVVSEEFLDGFFRSVFEDLPVGHSSTAVYALINEKEPFTVDFRVDLEFAIPGEVPTANFLIDRIREAFGRETSVSSYLFDLNQMSETNPFSAATAFDLVTKAHEVPPGSAGVNSGPVIQKPPSDPITNSGDPPEKSRMIVIFLVGTGSFVVVVLGFFWMRGRHLRRSVSSRLSRDKLDESCHTMIDDPAKSAGINNEDEENRYLDSIRQRYRDQEEDVSTNDKYSMSSAGYKDIDPSARDRSGSAHPETVSSVSLGGHISHSSDENVYSPPSQMSTSPQTMNGASRQGHICYSGALESDLARSYDEEKQEERPSHAINYLDLELEATGDTEEDDLRLQD